MNFFHILRYRFGGLESCLTFWQFQKFIFVKICKTKFLHIFKFWEKSIFNSSFTIFGPIWKWWEIFFSKILIFCTLKLQLFLQHFSTVHILHFLLCNFKKFGIYRKLSTRANFFIWWRFAKKSFLRILRHFEIFALQKNTFLRRNSKFWKYKSF